MISNPGQEFPMTAHWAAHSYLHAETTSQIHACYRDYIVLYSCWQTQAACTFNKVIPATWIHLSVNQIQFRGSFVLSQNFHNHTSWCINFAVFNSTSLIGCRVHYICLHNFTHVNQIHKACMVDFSTQTVYYFVNYYNIETKTSYTNYQDTATSLHGNRISPISSRILSEKVTDEYEPP